MHLLRKGRSACLLPTRHSVQLWRTPGVNKNSEECKSHSGHAQVHAQNVSTMAPPPWYATPDGQWHAKRTRRAPSTSKAALYYWRGIFRSWPFTTEGVSFNRPICSCCVLYTHSRATKRPHAASLPATPALGYRRCLIVFPVFRGAANDPEIDRATNSWDTASVVHLPQSIYPSATCALVHTECHGSPSVAKHGSISNSESFLDRGSAGSLRTPRNKSTVDTAAALWKATIQDHL